MYKKEAPGTVPEAENHLLCKKELTNYLIKKSHIA